MPETPIFNIPWTEDDDYVKDWPTLSKAIAEAVEAACGIATSVPQVTPPGAMTQFAGDEAHIPAGWLVCDGSSYSSNPSGLYYNLYKAISTRFGEDGTEGGFVNFRVPDMRGRFPRGVVNRDAGIGKDNAGGSDNAVVVSHNHGVSEAWNVAANGTTSATGGHTHGIHAGGSHTHGYAASHDRNGSHGFTAGPHEARYNWATFGTQTDAGGSHHTHGMDTAGHHAHALYVHNAGESGAGKNVPSYLPMYYIIKI